MRFFPLNIDSTNLKCLIVGGGTIAYRKLKILLKADFKIAVVAASCSKEMKIMIDEHNIKLFSREFITTDIDGYNLIVSATDNQETNKSVATIAASKGLLVNVVDQPDLSNFIFPAIIDRSPVTISISSDGQSPTISRFMRAELEKTIPFTIGKLAENAADIRRKNNMLPQDKKRKLWDDIFSNLSLHSTDIITDSNKNNNIKATITIDFENPDSITLRDYKLLHQANTILFPINTPIEIVEYFRREAAQITYKDIKETIDIDHYSHPAITIVNSGG